MSSLFTLDSLLHTITVSQSTSQWIGYKPFLNSGNIFLSFSKSLSNLLLKIEIVKNAVAEKADLRIFKEKPTPTMVSGFTCIVVSYIICWPVISVLGIIALYFKTPLIGIIGGIVIWNISNLLFIFGVYLAGARHSKVFLKWVTRLLVEKLSS